MTYIPYISYSPTTHDQHQLCCVAESVKIRTRMLPD